MARNPKKLKKEEINESNEETLNNDDAVFIDDKDTDSNLHTIIETETARIEKIMIPDIKEFPNDNELKGIPVLPLTLTCAFPKMPVSIPYDSLMNPKVISNAVATGQPVLLVYCNPDTDKEDIVRGCGKVGVLAKIVKHIPENSEENERGQIFCIGGPRVKVEKFTGRKNNPTASLRYYELKLRSDIKLKAELDLICHLHDEIINRDIHQEMKTEDLLKGEGIESFLSIISFQLPVEPLRKYEILSCESANKYCLKLIEILDHLSQLSKIQEEIRRKTHKNLDEIQKENYLQQQLNAIQNELGNGADTDIFNLKERAEKMQWSEATASHFENELKKLSRYNVNSPDYGIQYTYLDLFLNLPWNKFSEADYKFEDIERTLDRDHYGLEKVKERILEQMAVAFLRKDNRAPILCLVGPPGVGKTSLGKSIAEAMEREYARISFGGLHDEAEIRGHRKTYIGAMPGRIISAMAKMKTSNPVIVLDEIDKIGKDFKGDPSTALLEVLDPEQNFKFHDNYLDADFDLSNVMFIATANTTSTISSPLLDRMEIISIPGYITAEKVEIALRHLLPKELKKNGFDQDEISFDEEALTYIVDFYTKESGVRQLEKKIAKVLRKIALKKVKGEDYPVKINKKILKEFLGKEEYNPEMYENNDYIGVVTGLAWTPVGGEILFIESSITPGKGKLTLTGNLGEVMKESATIALQYLKANFSILGIDNKVFEKKDVHLHVPEGAIPKDGPSAGITMVTSLASIFTGKKIRANIAMTGEITLRGKVLPVGGIKEKIIAAKSAGIKEIILSADNRKDIEDINPLYLKNLKFIYVKNIAEVLDNALMK